MTSSSPYVVTEPCPFPRQHTEAVPMGEQLAQCCQAPAPHSPCPLCHPLERGAHGSCWQAGGHPSATVQSGSSQPQQCCSALIPASLHPHVLPMRMVRCSRPCSVDPGAVHGLRSRSISTSSCCRAAAALPEWLCATRGSEDQGTRGLFQGWCNPAHPAALPAAIRAPLLPRAAWHCSSALSSIYTWGRGLCEDLWSGTDLPR